MGAKVCGHLAGCMSECHHFSASDLLAHCKKTKVNDGRVSYQKRNSSCWMQYGLGNDGRVSYQRRNSSCWMQYGLGNGESIS